MYVLITDHAIGGFEVRAATQDHDGRVSIGRAIDVPTPVTDWTIAVDGCPRASWPAVSTGISNRRVADASRRYRSSLMLVPELDVADVAASLRFYVQVLGFRVLFERSSERFAYLERDGVELMVQEAAGPGRRFRTAPLEHPSGRGVNFQLRVDDVDAVHRRAVEAGVQVVVPMEERWYRVDVAKSGGRWKATGPSEAGNRQFVLADPDGYLWRPFNDLGMQPTSR